MSVRKLLLTTSQVLIIATLIVVGNAFGAPFGYGISQSKSLYSIDLATGSSSLIGDTGIDYLVEGVAIDDEGNLFATDENGYLYTLDSSNGLASIIGDTGRDNIEGLDLFGNTLYGIEFDHVPSVQQVFSIDTTTGSTTSLVTVDRNDILLTSSMTIMDSDTALFSGTLTAGTSYLFSVDLSSGETALVGDLGEFVGGLDFADDGNLYGLGNSGRILRIDPTNGEATYIASTTPYNLWLGLATYDVTPVPEPATLFLLSSGLVGLAAIRRSFKK
jgi:outer membrane protein assembly factor BamB